MRKAIYIILAIAIAVGLTVIQVVIAKKANDTNQTAMFMAVEDLEKGEVVREEDIQEIIFFTENSGQIPKALDSKNLVGKILLNDVKKDSLITTGDVFDNKDVSEEERFLSLEVNGSNFNADCLVAGDIVDIFFLPEFKNLENYQIVWLNEILSGYACFIKGKMPGILIENLTINHISKTAGDHAEYVSIRVPEPIDEAIAFLEQISEYEFIGR